MCLFRKSAGVIFQKNFKKLCHGFLEKYLQGSLKILQNVIQDILHEIFQAILPKLLHQLLWKIVHEFLSGNFPQLPSESSPEFLANIPPDDSTEIYPRVFLENTFDSYRNSSSIQNSCRNVSKVSSEMLHPGTQWDFKVSHFALIPSNTLSSLLQKFFLIFF